MFVQAFGDKFPDFTADQVLLPGKEGIGDQQRREQDEEEEYAGISGVQSLLKAVCPGCQSLMIFWVLREPS